MRPRLSRTLSRARWGEYRELLRAALEHGYELVPLESWVTSPGPPERRVMIMRHDVDQHPRSALTMARIERELGVRSSWYFRWRTAHPAVVDALRADGLDVGLHYETLTRRALELGQEAIGNGQVELCRAELQREIAAFERLFGSIRSAVPHGDSRLPGVRNSELLARQDCEPYGIEFDGNEAMRGRPVAHWLTDRTSAEGGWGDGADPLRLLAAGKTPILCLTHPNNWASGPSLWLDRVLRGASGASRREAPSSGRPIHTGPDRPPG